MPSSVLISCGVDGLRSWKASSTGLRASSSLRLQGDVKCSVFGGHGSILAVGFLTGGIEVRDGSRGSMIAELVSKQSAVNCVAFSGSSTRTLASGHENGYLRVWDVPARKVVKEYRSEQPVVCNGFRKGNDYIAYGTGTEVIVASVVSGSQVTHLDIESSQVTALDWSVHRKGVLAAVSEHGSLKVWDVTRSDISILSVPDAHTAPVTSVRFSPANNLLFCTASLDKRIRFYDVRARKAIKQIRVDVPISALDFHPSGCRAAIASTNGRLQLFDLRTGGENPSHSIQGHNSAIRTIRFRPMSNLTDTSHGVSRKIERDAVTTSPSTGSTPTPAKKRAHGHTPAKPKGPSISIFSPPKQTEDDETLTLAFEEESMIIPQAQEPITALGETSFSILNTRERLSNVSALVREDNKENFDSLKESKGVEIKKSSLHHTPSGREENLMIRPFMSKTVAFPTPEIGRVLSSLDRGLFVGNDESRNAIEDISSIVRGDSLLAGPVPTTSKDKETAACSPTVEDEHDFHPVTTTPSHPKQTLREELLKRTVEGALNDVVGDLRNDVRNLHLELLRGFHENQKETQRMLDEHTTAYQQLREEASALREENRRLRIHLAP